MINIDIDSILDANQWFVEASEEEVLDLLETQPNLSGLIQTIIEEDLEMSEEFPKDLLYSLYGTTLKAYQNKYDKSVKEVIEVDIDKAFEKQNNFAQSLSSSLGFDENELLGDDDENAQKIMQKLAELEEKYNTDESFDLAENGFGQLADLIQGMSSEMRQPELYEFLQNEIEAANLDDDQAGFLNQQLALVIDAFENMIERTSIR